MTLSLWDLLAIVGAVWAGTEVWIAFGFEVEPSWGLRLVGRLFRWVRGRRA